MSELQRRYLGELPQQMQANLAGLESLNAQLRMNNDNQVRLLERRGQLATQLEVARAESGDETDEMRLARLRRELTALRIKYTDLWPDIIRIKDEIARLEKQIGEPKPKAEPQESGAPHSPGAAPQRAAPADRDRAEAGEGRRAASQAEYRSVIRRGSTTRPSASRSTWRSPGTTRARGSSTRP